MAVQAFIYACVSTEKSMLLFPEVQHLTDIKLKKKITIGRKDKASFPGLGLKGLDIKMDTGAYTSAIHCHKIEKKKKGGKEILVFSFHSYIKAKL